MFVKGTAESWYLSQDSNKALDFCFYVLQKDGAAADCDGTTCLMKPHNAIRSGQIEQSSDNPRLVAVTAIFSIFCLIGLFFLQKYRMLFL